ncbi:MAG: D-sedoheptulose 7-phosphate isomerase [Candidatus Omnitrophica bacterium]|nr:D-sedoheptulose 7-phosphate isomerase [Candidatus Omnitrophota bacterium]
MKKRIVSIFKESIKVKEEIYKKQSDVISLIASLIIKSLKKGGKVILFGNGGSAADSQHIAGELIGRFKKERAALPAVALTTDTSIITSIANDYGFEGIFARQIEGLGKRGDVAIGISTSGNAQNVIAGIKQAKKMGIKTVAWTGGDGGKIGKLADISFVVPSNDTPRIQESHITCGHILCELIEEGVFKT